jgi:hypothetical protein
VLKRVDEVHLVGIILLSRDPSIASRIASVLRHGERLLWNHGDLLPSPQHEEAIDYLCVLDVRDQAREDGIRQLSKWRARMGHHARCVAIAASDRLGIQAVGYLGADVTEVIFPDQDHIELVLRAYLNDASRGVAGAVAMSVLSECLPEQCAPILNATIGSGLAASSVKECAAHAGRDRGTLRRALRNRRTAGLLPRDVVDVAKASYAVALLRCSSLTRTAVAHSIHLQRSTTLDRLLLRTFQCDASEARTEHSSVRLEVYLKSLLTQYRLRKFAT